MIHIDEPKLGQFACAHIFVEVDLEKGLLEANQLNMDGWVHIHALYSGRIPSVADGMNT